MARVHPPAPGGEDQQGKELEPVRLSGHAPPGNGSACDCAPEREKTRNSVNAECRDDSHHLAKKGVEPPIIMLPADQVEAGKKAHALRQHTLKDQDREFAGCGQRALAAPNRIDDKRKTKQAAEPGEAGGAKQLAPHQSERRNRAEFLEIPGALANFADHAHSRVARAPKNDQEIIERGGDRARRRKAGRGRRKYRNQEQHEARHQQKTRRREFEPEIALQLPGSIPRLPRLAQLREIEFFQSVAILAEIAHGESGADQSLKQ